MKINLLFVFIVLCIIVVASCEPNMPSKGSNTVETKEIPKTANELYTTHCVTCHGADGAMGMSGAKNLQDSKLENSEIIKQITHGKGMMSGFEGKMTAEEIEKVATYIVTLRK
jgi:mono/diheme cytochrome c family protein